MSRVTLPGQKQPTVSVWLISEEPTKRVLLVLHRKFNVWLQPGGHMEENEDPWEAAIRETREETGLDITKLRSSTMPDDKTWDLPSPDFLQLQTIPPHKDDPEHFHLDHQYVVRLPHQAIRVQEEESAGIGWYSLEELVDLPLFQNTKVRLMQLLSQPSPTQENA
jgi:8-oxo-dGTP pyrophosphatase MutT (NUDIX family)